MLRLAIDPGSFDDAMLDAAAGAIARGGIVAMATDTVYGLAVDPRRADAVRALFEVKGRSPAGALPVIAADDAQVVRWFGALPARAGELARQFWPGPLSLLLPAPAAFAAEVHAGTGLIAVRVPNHQVARSLARVSGVPVTATSANLSGVAAAATADEVEASLGSAIDVLIDTGPSRGGPPSTIVEVSGDRLRLVREGALPWERVLRSFKAL